MLGRAIRPSFAESLTSFLSRQAMVYGTSLTGFLADVGLRYWDVMRGEPTVIGALAALTGVSPDDLAGRAIIGTMGGRTLAGHHVGKNGTRLRRLLVCPACLRDDQAGAPGDGTPAVYVRLEWTVRWVTTCVRHHLALIEIDDGQDLDPQDVHEVSSRLMYALDAERDRVVPWLARVDRRGSIGSLVEVPRDPTPLEHHIVRRLHGGSTKCFAGSLDLDVSAAVSENIGASMHHGRERLMSVLTEEETRLAGGAGFKVLSAGEPGICMFLGQLQASYVRTDNHAMGAYQVLGNFQRFLAHHAGEAPYEPVLDVVRRHIASTMPVAAGTKVLGNVLHERKVHSLAAARKELARPGVRLRALLGEAGLLPAGYEAMPANHVQFDAAAAAPIIDALKSGMLLAAAARRIGTSTATLKLLAAAGLVEHRAMPMGSRAPWSFRPEALDTFLERLAVDARPIREVGGSIQPLADAGRLLAEPPVHLTKLIVEGRLTWVGRRAGRRGMDALLVDVDEVRRFIRLGEVDGLRKTQLPRLLGITTSTVFALVNSGVLRTTETFIQNGRRQVNVVTRESVERYHAEYTPIKPFVRDVGGSYAEVKRMIKVVGIIPAFPYDLYDASIYRRKEIKEGWSVWRRDSYNTS